MEENVSPAPQSTGETTALDPAASAEAASQAQFAEHVAATVPPLPQPSGDGKKETIFGKFKRKMGRPRKPDELLKEPRRRNKFAAPKGSEAQPGASLESPVDTGAGADPGGAQAEPADYSGYGKAGASLVCGIYEIRIVSIRNAAEKKLPKSTVDGLLAGFSVPDGIKGDLEIFYAELAEEFNLPPGGGKIAQGIAAHVNLELHFRTMTRELLNALASMKERTKPVDVDATVEPEKGE